MPTGVRTDARLSGRSYMAANILGFATETRQMHEAPAQNESCVRSKKLPSVLGLALGIHQTFLAEFSALTEVRWLPRAR